MDNGEALMQNLCPTAYEPHNKGRYTVVTLLIQTDPERWRAGLVCDGLLVIEGPENGYKQDAMMTLSEVISARLAKAIQRAWDVDDAETDVEEHASGARFATEPQR
ncbi:hypothetical protein LTR85_005793 [Meristemomyces frigidus]|nr:hypothetical protein LTR85_005793 [Meristemomyces frigidus]